MKHTDFYSKYKELEAQEREELTKAVLAHGGEFRFLTEDGEDIEGISAPVIIAGGKHWESNCDCIVSRVTVEYGFPEIYGYDCNYKDEEVYLSSIEFGHLGYIIDAIPETDDVHDVSTEPSIYVVPVANLCREGIKESGYNPDVPNEELQQ